MFGAAPPSLDLDEQMFLSIPLGPMRSPVVGQCLMATRKQKANACLDWLPSVLPRSLYEATQNHAGPFLLRLSSLDMPSRTHQSVCFTNHPGVCQSNKTDSQEL